jgi:hypothetical protein
MSPKDSFLRIICSLKYSNRRVSSSPTVNCSERRWTHAVAFETPERFISSFLAIEKGYPSCLPLHRQYLYDSTSHNCPSPERRRRGCTKMCSPAGICRHLTPDKSATPPRRTSTPPTRSPRPSSTLVSVSWTTSSWAVPARTTSASRGQGWCERRLMPAPFVARVDGMWCVQPCTAPIEKTSPS